MPDTTLKELKTERDLLDLLARFDDDAIRTDLAAFRELWTEDATWEIAKPLPMKASGQDAIVTALKSLQQSNRFFFRMTGRPVIDVSGDKAALRAPTVELAQRGDGRIYANVAFYVDQAVRDDSGAWRFKSRSYQYIWVDIESDMPGQAVALHTSPAN